jgi:hypothetical protein
MYSDEQGESDKRRLRPAVIASSHRSMLPFPRFMKMSIAENMRPHVSITQGRDVTAGMGLLTIHAGGCSSW